VFFPWTGNSPVASEVFPHGDDDGGGDDDTKTPSVIEWSVAEALLFLLPPAPAADAPSSALVAVTMFAASVVRLLHLPLFFELVH